MRRESLRVLVHPLALVLVAAAGCASVSPASRQGDTERPEDPPPAPFKAASIAAEPTRVSKRHPFTALLEEVHASFDKQGKLTTRRTLHYLIDNLKGVQELSTASVQWSPWSEERPDFDLTVVLPDGRRIEVDPKTYEESDVGGKGNTFKQLKSLRAPLPRIAVGVVVERVVTTRQHRLLFPGGVFRKHEFAARASVQKSRLIVEAETPINWLSVGGDNRPISETKEMGEHRLVFEVGELPYYAEEEDTPPGRYSQPSVVYSVAPSWERLGNEYAKEVDRQIARSVGALPPKSRSYNREMLIKALIAKVHRRVRYTGLEFGKAAVIPVSPHVALERGYGDCKDKATLLIALLRKHNINAHIALINDSAVPYSSVPGLNQFNHAIVYVPGPNPLWIDATVENHPLNIVQSNLQGRTALVARTSGSSLVKLPESLSAANVTTYTKRIDMADFGPGTLQTTWKATGVDRVSLRRMLDPQLVKLLRLGLQGQVRSAFGGKELEAFEVRGADGRERPSISYRATVPKVVMTEPATARLNLHLEELRHGLPDALDSDQPPRRSDLEFTSAGVLVLDFEIRVAPGFEPTRIPPTKQVQVGGGTFGQRFSYKERILRATFRLDTGPRVWTAAQVEAFRQYEELFATRTIEFRHAAMQLAREGRGAESLKAYRRLIRREPKSASHHSRMAMTLLSLGLASQARVPAARGAVLSPRDSATHFVNGMVLGSDVVGGPSGRPADRAGALAAYRRVLTLDPTNRAAADNLIELLESNEHRERLDGQLPPKATLRIYDAIDKTVGRPVFPQERLRLLLHLGQFDEVLKVGKTEAYRDFRSYAVAAAIAKGGLPLAKEVLSRAGPLSVNDKTAFVEAGHHLARMRQYGLAAVAANYGGPLDDLDSALDPELLAKARRTEDIIKSLPAPSQVALRFVESEGLGRFDEAVRTELYSNAALQDWDRAEQASPGSQATAAHRRFRLQLDSLGDAVSARMHADLATSVVKPQLEGSDAVGYRVKLNGFAKKPARHIFVVQEGGRPKFRADETQPAALGLEAIRRLRRNDEAGARQWLSWAYELPMMKRYDYIWNRPEAPNLDKLWLAAAFAASMSGHPSEPAFDVLSKANFPPGPQTQSDLHLALCRADPGGPGARFKHAATAFKLNSSNRAALEAMATHATTEETRTLVEQELIKMDDHDALYLRAKINADAGHIDTAQRLLSDFFVENTNYQVSYELRAWNALFAENQEGMVQDALRAVRSTKFKAVEPLRVLASVYAMTDKPLEAMMILRSLRLRRGGHFAPADYLVLGRVLEGYGYFRDARRAYARVTPSNPRSAVDPARLARQREKLIRNKR